MRAASTARKALALAAATIAFEAAVTAIDLRLRSGDEGRQAVDAAIVRHRRLRLLILRLVALIAVFTRLVLLLARLIGLLMVALAVVALARLIRLLLLRHKSRLLTEAGKALILLAIFRNHVGIGPRLLLRLILAELLLGRGNQAEVMLGMLIVIFRSDRIAGGARITRQLYVFFSNVRCSATDFDIRSVGFEHPGHRVLATPVIIVVVIVPVTHPLVVLTVSHVVPLIQP